jgi:hypothetical protein
LKYKYNGQSSSSNRNGTNPVATTVVENLYLLRLLYPFDTKDVNLLYAQATSTGYQLIDSTPKVVMKLLKHHKPTFIAIKDSVQGSLILKDNQWF